MTKLNTAADYLIKLKTKTLLQCNWMAKITYYPAVTIYFNGNSGKGLCYNEIF